MVARLRSLNPIELLRRYSVLLILVGMVAIMSILSPDFLSVSNLLTILKQSSILAIIALGMTFTMLTAGIDLSVGSVAALCGALAAGLAVRAGLDTSSAFLLALLAGCGLGAINGLLVVRGGLPPFVATLAMLAAARGLTLVYTQASPISGLKPSFVFWGSDNLGPIPMLVIVMVLVYIIGWVVLSRTRFGLHLYAVGGNEETARLAGIPTRWVKAAAYVISGLTAALGGILLTARLYSAQPTAATGMELDAIAAAVLGGTSLFGAVGSAGGALAGALIIGILANGMDLLAVAPYSQQVIRGAVFILAVMFDLYTKRRR